jgi:hypothetical protein
MAPGFQILRDSARKCFLTELRQRMDRRAYLVQPTLPSACMSGISGYNLRYYMTPANLPTFLSTYKQTLSRKFVPRILSRHLQSSPRIDDVLSADCCAIFWSAAFQFQRCQVPKSIQSRAAIMKQERQCQIHTACQHFLSFASYGLC